HYGGRIRDVEGGLEGIGALLPSQTVDLVVWHHALGDVADGVGVRKRVYPLASRDGQVSLITLNPVSEAVRAAVFQRDASAALSKLDDLRYDAKWFGNAHLYPLEDILARAADAGWTLRDFRGIRVLSDYVPDAEAAAQEDT